MNISLEMKIIHLGGQKNQTSDIDPVIQSSNSEDNHDFNGQSSAPWRKSSVQKKQPAIKNSPSLNLVSVTITPSCNSDIEPCDIRTEDLKHGSQGNDKPLSQTENLQKFSQRESALPLESVIKTSKEMDSAMSKA